MNLPVAVALSVVGFLLLWKGADWLVDGASRLAMLAKLSPIIIGITIVAFGTSLPEVAVSLAASVKDEPGITIGNVVGSNIANVLLVLGLAAVIRPLKMERRVVTHDSMIVAGAGVVLFLLALTGKLTRLHGLLLLACFAGYLYYYFRYAAQHRTETELDIGERKTNIAIVMTVGGIICILIGSDVLVDSAVYIATWAGISPAVIGLTMIAVGTSLPELATSVVASKKGKVEISIGNVLGSNVFNTFLVIGLATALIGRAIEISSGLLLDIIFMAVVCLALVPTLWTDLILSRREGYIMLTIYAIYIGLMAVRGGMI